MFKVIVRSNFTCNYAEHLLRPDDILKKKKNAIVLIPFFYLMQWHSDIRSVLILLRPLYDLDLWTVLSFFWFETVCWSVEEQLSVPVPPQALERLLCTDVIDEQHVLRRSRSWDECTILLSPGPLAPPSERQICYNSLKCLVIIK